MANGRKKNTIFIDATGNVSVDALKPILMGVLITPSAADSRVVINESASGTAVVDVKIVAVESRFLDFSGIGGVELTSTFEIATLTNITSVLLYGSWLAPVGKAR